MSEVEKLAKLVRYILWAYGIIIFSRGFAASVPGQLLLELF
jgi:hypothetical protein